ncbi:MAG: hypothetical protein JWN89_614 [Parcubacteria group bacterium]|nr:hypothetical protein [Parcubacteria group bacterium]
MKKNPQYQQEYLCADLPILLVCKYRPSYRRGIMALWHYDTHTCAIVLTKAAKKLTRTISTNGTRCDHECFSRTVLQTTYLPLSSRSAGNLAIFNWSIANYTPLLLDYRNKTVACNRRRVPVMRRLSRRIDDRHVLKWRDDLTDLPPFSFHRCRNALIPCSPSHRRSSGPGDCNSCYAGHS